ncbi:MAG TPA: thiol peroxidase [Candidatus Hydrogenedentes bacterium]|nr:thiol peroxidase [Candidatus Hydrogenedentota bacterium]HRK33680.1 thiol peroxidase [Candidatus Hydrogenedentota bacterium]
MQERTGELTFKGNPLTVLGKKVAVGDKAPDFTLLANDLSPVTLATDAGKVRVISVVPSLDTPVCDIQTRRFSEEIGKLGDKVVCYTVSADLPFAQKRWCGSAGVTSVISLSDHRDMNFGNAYGTHIKELRLEQRSVFVVDGNGVVQYAEYVPEVAQEPVYDAPLAKAKELAG